MARIHSLAVAGVTISVLSIACSSEGPLTPLASDATVDTSPVLDAQSIQDALPGADGEVIDAGASPLPDAGAKDAAPKDASLKDAATTKGPAVIFCEKMAMCEGTTSAHCADDEPKKCVAEHNAMFECFNKYGTCVNKKFPANAVCITESDAVFKCLGVLPP